MKTRVTEEGIIIFIKGARIKLSRRFLLEALGSIEDLRESDAETDFDALEAKFEAMTTKELRVYLEELETKNA